MNLQKLLKGQDFGQKEIERITEKVLHDEPITDPITAIIVYAWQNNGGAEGEFDQDGFSNDLQYAIDQIQKAQTTLNQTP